MDGEELRGGVATATMFRCGPVRGHDIWRGESFEEPHLLRWVCQTAPKFPGSVPFSMNVGCSITYIEYAILGAHRR
jgi:hypothetical protein